MFHRVFNKPYAANEVFGNALDQAVLYNDLLQKIGGDRATVERLIDFERQQTTAGHSHGLVEECHPTLGAG